MFIIKYRKIFFTISALLVAGAIFSILSFGLNLGIDFKGGSILEVSYSEARPELSIVNKVIAIPKPSLKPIITDIDEL